MTCLCDNLPNGCRQGRGCPLRETEAACDVAHHSQGNFRPVARATSLWQTIIVGIVLALTGASLAAFVIGAVFYTFRA